MSSEKHYRAMFLIVEKIFGNFYRDFKTAPEHVLQDLNQEILRYKDNLLRHLHVWKPFLEPRGEASDTQNV